MSQEFPKLKAAEEKGCDTCKLLRRALLHRYNDEAIAEASVDWGYPPGTARPSWNHRVTLTPERGRMNGMFLRDCRIAYVLVESVLRPQETSCGGFHRLILPQTPEPRLPRLPRRVIDVGSAGGSEAIRLIDSGNVPGNYIVLSHCWGSGTKGAIRNESKLLQGNMESLQRGIDFESLANNFKDAITATRKLQARYLWIDALCIIQDSPSDWARESAHMDEIYGNAYLTLAATSAKSSNDGFLRDYEFPVAIRAWEDPGDRTIAGKIYLTYRRTVKPTPWLYIQGETLWSTRGWTFQERLMSRRVLHFLPDYELAWECRTEDDAQNAAKDANRQPYERGYWILNKDEDPKNPDPVPGFDRIYERWYWIASK
ncbi:MAG: hypothetical protein LQ350_000016 [Teloschistes chrysophthalmus]|nr:MAG: hypothetical protein LQ350_000016 [Niorma chrysophthalma]